MNKIPAQTVADLSVDELKKLAVLSKASYMTLRHFAAGRRQMSSTMAIEVERAGKRMGLNLPRELHANGCRRCEFARQCRKEMVK